LAEEFCRKKGVSLLRIDTHEDNKRMQHILAKNGFVYCGIVLQNGSDRLAYEKKL
jgi:RimJ/RimL family protein N-acetyltransferase